MEKLISFLFFVIFNGIGEVKKHISLWNQGLNEHFLIYIHIYICMYIFLYLLQVSKDFILIARTFKITVCCYCCCWRIVAALGLTTGTFASARCCCCLLQVDLPLRLTDNDGKSGFVIACFQLLKVQ